MRKFYLLFLFVMLWGCSSPKTNRLPARFRKLKNLTVYPANARPEKTISPQKDAVYDSTKKVLTGGISNIAVDDSGRVFIADDQQNTIDVFEPGGRFLTHLGRNGRGPGDFSSIAGLQIRRDHLYVYDERQLEESVFTLHPLALENTILLAKKQGQVPGIRHSLSMD